MKQSTKLIFSFPSRGVVMYSSSRSSSAGMTSWIHSIRAGQIDTMVAIDWICARDDIR